MDNKQIASINILGKDYTIMEQNEFDDARLARTNGYCDWSEQKIVIDENLSKRDNAMRIGNVEMCREKIIRHEIMHAFFMASGLTQYSQDETLVEWFATQAYEIFQAMSDAGAIKVTFSNE